MYKCTLTRLRILNLSLSDYKWRKFKFEKLSVQCSDWFKFIVSQDIISLRRGMCYYFYILTCYKKVLLHSIHEYKLQGGHMTSYVYLYMCKGGFTSF